MRQPYIYMLVGTPYSGKSTWTKEFVNNEHRMVVIDTDKYLEDKAAQHGITYNEAFHRFSKDAEKAMYDKVRKAVGDLRDIIWDQTNMTVKSRARKLAMIPGSYIKIAVAFTQPSKEELDRRMSLRVDKQIGQHIIDNMLATYQPPTVAEGFNTVLRVKNN